MSNQHHNLFEDNPNGKSTHNCAVVACERALLGIRSKWAMGWEIKRKWNVHSHIRIYVNEECVWDDNILSMSGRSPQSASSASWPACFRSACSMFIPHSKNKTNLCPFVLSESISLWVASNFSFYFKFSISLQSFASTFALFVCIWNSMAIFNSLAARFHLVSAEYEKTKTEDECCGLFGRFVAGTVNVYRFYCIVN